ncbi:hypothetical protein JS562_51680 [Agrobacterium sp. S2]|nr:hypothetical protein [Agrobacterium sp. S2]
MRVVQYPKKGRPASRIAKNLQELVMLTQAAISIANTERRVLDRVGNSIREKNKTLLPSSVDSERTSAYEVTVVDLFYQLGQQSFAAHGSAPIWERPFKTGKRGRPKAVDVALFRHSHHEETRIEFGAYSKSKLKKDAKKLRDLTGSPLIPGISSVSNYAILWNERDTRLTAASVNQWTLNCEADAASASSTSMVVTLEMTSSVDLFSEVASQYRVADVAIFSVTVP